MKCKYCNHESQMFFCPNCGKVIEYPSFIKDDAKRERQIAEFVLDMVTDANRKRIEVSKLIDNGALAEAIYRKYFEHVTFFQLLCDRPEIKHYFEKDGVINKLSEPQLFMQRHIEAMMYETAEWMLSSYGLLEK